MRRRGEERRAAFKWCLNLCCRKDVRLPVQLQRAMAAEAEAAREARAKVRRQSADFLPLCEGNQHYRKHTHIIPYKG